MSLYLDQVETPESSDRHRIYTECTLLDIIQYALQPSKAAMKLIIDYSIIYYLLCTSLNSGEFVHFMIHSSGDFVAVSSV